MIDYDNEDDTAGGVQVFVVFRAHTDGNDVDDNDDYDHGSQDASPLRWMWSHMTIMMVLMTNDHSDFDLNLDLQDAGPLGWLPSPQPHLHGLSVPGCQPGQG